jgi:2-polyprenyl-6-methoxyphenol hydroxylase-like FAD-dependent oxidoreductase
LQAGGVDLRAGVRVNGLARGPGGQWRVDCADGEPVGADLVVDASGRSSRLPVWLAALGVPVPEVEEIDARTGYATRVYHDGPDLGPLSGLVIQATPGRPTGSAVLPVENGRHLVGVIGYGDHRPPRDEDGFLALIRGLTDPCVADFVAAARPCGPVVVHRQTANRHHHYERLRSWPAGLLPIGDSFVSLNPIYGQGITVAAGQAVALRTALRATGRPDTRSLVRRFAGLARLPWQVATGQDLRQPSCPGRPSRSAALSNAWVLTVQKLAVHGNLRAYAALNRVYHLLAPPSVLVHPALLLAAARARVFGYPPPVARPTGVPGPPR